MADCCTSSTGFPTASSMEQMALNHSVIWEEICLIQQGILSAASQCQTNGGQMCATIGGSTPMTFVSGVSSVTVVNGGSGYVQDTPSVNFIPPNGSIASGATASVTTNGGSISAINMITAGTGYAPISATMQVTSVLGTGAVIEPLVDAAGQIVNINIASAGTGYTVGDSVTASRAVLPNIAYVDAIFSITSVGITGDILDIAILNPGSGYQDSVTEIEIVSSLNPLLPYPTGAGFQGTVFVDGLGAVTGVLITNTGAGYADFLPYLVITDPGTGAETTVALSGTSVASITVDESGTEYTSSATGTVLNPPTAASPNPPASPAVVTINVANNAFGTDPSLYWQVWSGATTNRPIQLQLNSVLSYFTGLGYTISIISNPLTGSTISWKICW